MMIWIRQRFNTVRQHCDNTTHMQLVSMVTHITQLYQACAGQSQDSTLTPLCLAGSDGYNLCNVLFHSTEYEEVIGCGVDRATSIIVDCIVALALLYFLITYILLFAKLRGYRKQPYAFVQVGLVYNTLQVSHKSQEPRVSVHSPLVYDATVEAGQSLLCNTHALKSVA